jgi:three-Cys-motif partner protein
LTKQHRDEHFSEFRGHTLLKHGVLDRYAKAWIQILKRSHSEIWIVDGFAGKGKDDIGNPGSPLLLVGSAAQLREEGAEVHVIAIEFRRDWYEALATNLADFDAEHGGRVPVVYLRQGTLAEHAPEAFRLIGQAPAFVYLDPFGADGLSLNIVRQTLALGKGEVFALFSHQAICRHLAVLAAEYHSDRARREVIEQPQLFPDLEAKWLTQELDRAERADASLLPTKEAAERILVELFGSSEEVERLLDLPERTWADEVLRAYLDALRRCGATHITRTAIYDEEQKCAYYLIHAAKSPRATLKMKEAVHSAISKSELPAKTKDRIRWSHAVRIEEVVREVLKMFAGREVGWTDPVKGFALGETPMAVDQTQELKAALAPYVIERKPLRFRFPDAE